MADLKRADSKTYTGVPGERAMSPADYQLDSRSSVRDSVSRSSPGDGPRQSASDGPRSSSGDGPRSSFSDGPRQSASDSSRQSSSAGGLPGLAELNKMSDRDIQMAMCTSLRQLHIKIDALAGMMGKGDGQAPRPRERRAPASNEDKTTPGSAQNVMEYFKRAYVMNPEKYARWSDSRQLESIRREVQSGSAAKKGATPAEINKSIAAKLWAGFPEETKKKAKAEFEAVRGKPPKEGSRAPGRRDDHDPEYDRRRSPSPPAHRGGGRGFDREPEQDRRSADHELYDDHEDFMPRGRPSRPAQGDGYASEE